MAQEIAQDVFLTLYKYFDTMEEERMLGWLVTTAKNAAKNHTKRARREIPDENVDLLLERRIDNIVESAEETVFDNMRRKEEIQLGGAILEALYEKNERWYEAVTMVYCMDKKQADVADKMGISIEVLHSVLYRARKWIRKNFNTDEYTR